jgi:fumarylacetoacetate (FAA) hydrolase family protein
VFAEDQIRAFEADKAQSREVTYKEWTQRGLWKRFLEVVTGPFRSQM